jgi:hypothetical protein
METWSERQRVGEIDEMKEREIESEIGRADERWRQKETQRWRKSQIGHHSHVGMYHPRRV